VPGDAGQRPSITAGFPQAGEERVTGRIDHKGSYLALLDGLVMALLERGLLEVPALSL